MILYMIMEDMVRTVVYFFPVTAPVIPSLWTFDMIAVTRYTYDMAMMDQAVKDRCSGQFAGK